MSSNLPVQLGLCCMNTTLKKQKPAVYCSRRLIMRTIQEKGIEVLKDKIIQNLDDLLVMIQWNEDNGIKVFRLSSELFVHKTNPKVKDYTFDFAIPHLQRIGDLAKKYNQRLTFHPGQYNVLASKTKKAYYQTIKDLEYHADVLDLMGMDKHSVIVIHGGGVYGEKEQTKLRWCENYKKLPEKIKRRLVLENCEHSYSIVDCLEMSDICGVPIVFDTHHFECYRSLHPNETFEEASYYIPSILKTWKDIKPKFHVSEQGDGKVGKHSDYIEILPEYLLEIPKKYGIHIDIMIEAKMKELSIKKLYEKYPQCNCLNISEISDMNDTTKQVSQ